MSYRMYLTLVPEVSPETQVLDEESAFREHSSKTRTAKYFDIISSLSIGPDIRPVCIGTCPAAQALLPTCPAYFTDTFLYHHPEFNTDSNSPEYVGILSDEKLQSLIQTLHQEEIQRLETAFANPEKSVSEIADRLLTWHQSLDALPQNKSNTMPKAVADSFEFLIFKLWVIQRHKAGTHIVLFGW